MGYCGRCWEEMQKKLIVGGDHDSVLEEPLWGKGAWEAQKGRYLAISSSYLLAK